jgi:hypothetical protein
MIGPEGIDNDKYNVQSTLPIRNIQRRAILGPSFHPIKRFKSKIENLKSKIGSFYWKRRPRCGTLI